MEAKNVKRRKGEYFIGMTYSSSANRRYSKRKRQRLRQLYLRRTLIVSLCAVVLAGIGAVTYFCLVPSVSKLFVVNKSAVSTTDEATANAVSATEKKEDVKPQNTPATQPPSEAPTEEPEKTPDKPASADNYVTPVIADDGKNGTLFSSTLYLYNGKGFNLFGSTEKVAKNYATTINNIAKKLDKNITVYNMVIPNHTEFGLPQRIQTAIGCTSQADNLKQIAKNLDSRVTSINAYNALAEHNDEYIYYNTDHHWTSLGAYYAYTAFCEQTGQTPVEFSKLKANSISGFIGSFYTLSSSSALKNNADTVIYYTLPNKTSATMTERMGSSSIACDVYYPASTGGSLTYGVFCWGDTAKFVIKSDAGTGKKIAVVKDSYGNAFAPYLTANYDEVHLLDYRYYDGNLNDYLKSNGITEVIFLNNTMSANSTSQVTAMKNALS